MVLFWVRTANVESMQRIFSITVINESIKAKQYLTFQKH
jgi:hypothetical protein